MTYLYPSFHYLQTTKNHFGDLTKGHAFMPNSLIYIWIFLGNWSFKSFILRYSTFLPLGIFTPGLFFHLLLPIFQATLIGAFSKNYINALNIVPYRQSYNNKLVSARIEYISTKIEHITICFKHQVYQICFLKL